MKIVKGAYASAKIFTDIVEEYALAQIQMLCDNKAFQDQRIRIMPDVHPGKVGTIGFTSTVGERILPNVVGTDIGCGITLAKLKQKRMECQKLDTIIRDNIPAGFKIRKAVHRFSNEIDFTGLYCFKHIHIEKAKLSLGTLGGGNHFIEIDQDEEGFLYIAIHSGSRHLGKEITEHYLNEGQKCLKEDNIQVPYELTYLEGRLMAKYLHDLQIVQAYADINRKAILDELVKGMKWKVEEAFSVSHNYVHISDNHMVLRKGAISAGEGEMVIIPVNMREGIILGKGLGNADWNDSAPHGAGRVMKREDVKQQYTVSAFKEEMKGIYCSCIGKDTLDEAPFAYRSISELAKYLNDTMEIQQIIKPVYNFKAGGK